MFRTVSIPLFVSVALIACAHEHDHSSHDHGSPNTADDLISVPPTDAESDGQSDSVTDISAPAQVWLVDNTKWSLTPSDQDPWFAAAQDPDTCIEDDIKVETPPDGTWFEVDTTLCGYMTAHQNSIAELRDGDSLKMVVHHDPVTAGDGPYTIAVAVGDPATVVGSITKEIPLEEGWISERFEINQDYPVGTLVYFHVSNHGANNWALTRLLIEPATE